MQTTPEETAAALLVHVLEPFVVPSCTTSLADGIGDGECDLVSPEL